MEREFYPIRYRQLRCCNGERVPAVPWAASAIRVCWTAFPHDDVAHAVGDSDTWSDRLPLAYRNRRWRGLRGVAPSTGCL